MGRRCSVPGAHPDLFDPRIERHRGTPGQCGQFVELDHPLTGIHDPRDVNLYGAGLEFLWVAGDGNTPTVGPTLVDAGAGPYAEGSPWQLASEEAVESEGYYGGGSRRSTATVVDPTAAEDFVAFMLYLGRNAGSTRQVFGNRNAAAGWCILYGNTLGAYIQNAVFQNFSRTKVDGAWNLVVLMGSPGGDGTLWTPQTFQTRALGAGVIGNAEGLGIAARPDGSLPFDGSIVVCGVKYGVGLYADWIASSFAKCNELVCALTGACSRQGGIGTFTRTSSASWQDRNGAWALASPGIPRGGDSGGLRAAPSRTNKVYNNTNPQVTTGWSVTGGTHTTPSDYAQLAADGCEAWGFDVHQFVPGGSDQVIYGGAQTGNTNKHALSVLMRGAAGGESVDIGLRDASSGVVQNAGSVVLTTSWQRFVIHNVTPADIDQQFCLDCDAGDTVLFVAAQLEEGVRATTPIPNFATAASATRAVERLDTVQAPADTEGSVEAVVTPMGWSGIEPAADVDVITRTGGADDLLHAESASGGWATSDGTTQIQETTAPADGVSQCVRVRWDNDGDQNIDVDGSRVRGAYDGSRSGAGQVRLEASTAELSIKELKIYRNGGG